MGFSVPLLWDRTDLYCGTAPPAPFFASSRVGFLGDHQGSSIFEVRADLLEVFQGWISSSGIHCTAILSGDSDVLGFFDSGSRQ